jgi:hypothetical protein
MWKWTDFKTGEGQWDGKLIWFLNVLSAVSAYKATLREDRTGREMLEDD